MTQFNYKKITSVPTAKVVLFNIFYFLFAHGYT